MRHKGWFKGFMICRIRELAMAMPTTQAIISHMSLYAIPTDKSIKFSKRLDPPSNQMPKLPNSATDMVGPFHVGLLFNSLSVARDPTAFISLKCLTSLSASWPSIPRTTAFKSSSWGCPSSAPQFNYKRPKLAAHVTDRQSCIVKKMHVPLGQMQCKLCRSFHVTRSIDTYHVTGAF